MTDNAARQRVLDLYESDLAAIDAGITIAAIADGSVELQLNVTARMANGHGIIHGGYLFFLADTAFAYCCVSLDRLSVTRTADVAFIGPASVGESITARAVVRSLHGRNTICDVSVTNADGSLIAEFRGHGSMIVIKHAERSE